MVVCLFRVRKSLLIDSINNIQLKLMKLSQKRYDLLAYGDAIADGKITWDEMARMPKSLRRRTNDFIFGCQNPALQAAQADAGMYINNMQRQNAMMAQQNPQFYMDETQLADQAFAINEGVTKSYLEAEARKQQEMIHREECKIEQEQKRLESTLAAYQKELEQVEKAEQKAIDFATVKYVNDGR